MSATLRRVLLAAVFLVVVWVIWERLHIVVFMRGLDLLILLAVLAAAFLLAEHFLNRERR